LAEGSSLPWHLPVVQAPIGPATTWELVAAVSAVGGLGTLAASWTELAELGGQIGRIVSATANPFCVNLVLAFDQRDRLELLLECGVPVVSFSWGIDAALIGRARQAGLTVFVQVADEYEAKAAAAAGADALVAQGVEAGGHVQGSTRLLSLVRKVRAAVELPIVAAGGIADAVAARNAIAAGAQAVACGSAFLAASEADVNPRYLARILAAEASDTQVTGLFDVGWPHALHRVIRNRTLTDWEQAGSPPPGTRPGEGELIASRRGAPIVRYSDAQPTTQIEGAIDAMAMYAGHSVEHLREVASAQSITRNIADSLG
jgi:NAD(P)H-dependent flavin oxidoreductase YrpB (nitropropane dioxygenase family)